LAAWRLPLRFAAWGRSYTFFLSAPFNRNHQGSLTAPHDEGIED
jgi:hypothetical protein